MMQLIRRYADHRRREQAFRTLKRRAASWSFEYLEFAARMGAITPREFHRLCDNVRWRDYSDEPLEADCPA